MRIKNFLFRGKKNVKSDIAKTDLRETAAKVNAILPFIDDEDVMKKIKDVQRKIWESPASPDKKGYEYLNQISDELDELLDLFQNAASAPDPADVIRRIKKMESLIELYGARSIQGNK